MCDVGNGGHNVSSRRKHALGLCQYFSGIPQMLQKVAKKNHIKATLSKCPGPVEFFNIRDENFTAVSPRKLCSLLVELNSGYNASTLDKDTVEITCCAPNIEQLLIPAHKLDDQRMR